MLNRKIFLWVLGIIIIVPSAKAARVGRHQAAQPYANIVHTDANSLLRGPAGDERNRASIDDLIENHTQHLIYCVTNHPQPLNTVISNILERVFHLDGGPGAGGMGLAFQIINHTRFYKFLSGADANAITANLFANENISIRNSYSNINDIGGSHGSFNIESATRLLHTEPKALDKVLEIMANVVALGLRVSDIILITRRPICAPCSKLLLNVINARRNTAGFPNVIIMSRAQLQNFPNDGAIINSIHNSLRNQIVQAVNDPGFNAGHITGATPIASIGLANGSPLVQGNPMALALVEDWRTINALFTTHIDTAGNELALFVYYIA